ncbi:hypothetical protein LINGRAHAP2_LOCUS2576 [Linum grandiflorum]
MDWSILRLLFAFAHRLNSTFSISSTSMFLFLSACFSTSATGMHPQASNALDQCLISSRFSSVFTLIRQAVFRLVISIIYVVDTFSYGYVELIIIGLCLFYEQMTCSHDNVL